MSSEHETFVTFVTFESMAMRLLWEYTLTDCMSMIQFAKVVYSENSLEFSILIKMLHNIFGHNTDYVIYSGVCFVACLPATVFHDLLRDKFLLS